MNQSIVFLLLALFFCACQKENTSQKADTKTISLQGWNILSSHKTNGLRTLDTAQAYGANYIELSHYQLCHFLKDLRQEKNCQAVNFFTQEAHQRGIQDVFLWDHAFYEMDYYPDRFKIKVDSSEVNVHHTSHFEGGLNEKLNLDDSAFWNWVYQDYDSLLSLAPDINGISLTFIETGSYVLYQHSEKLKNGSEKIAALVDSLANYFIDRKGLKLTIRTFIYNQFEKDKILQALQLIQRKDLKVMVKMVPHDWFMTYPYQNFIEEIPFPTIIEYDGGMEYAGENLIANTFVKYFADAFRYYHQYENVVGYCIRTDRFEETAAVGTPGEINLYALARLSKNPELSDEEITRDFILKNYGEATLPYLQTAFDQAWEVIMASMYTLAHHTANHSRLNYHRASIYLTHTTGEWYPPNQQMSSIQHGLNKEYHNYKDILNALAFPKYKSDTLGLQKDIAWVLDSAWLEPQESMTLEFLEDIMTEKQHAVDLAKTNLELVEKALPFIQDSLKAENLYHTFYRTLIFTLERKAIAEAVYGYRLWSRGADFQSKALQKIIWNGLNQGDSLIKVIENYPVHIPLGQWRWHRDREAFNIYYQAISQKGWKEFGLEGITVPKP